MGRYQGEVLDKAMLHAHFERKLARSQQARTAVGDWSGLCAIVDTMRAAFHDSDAIAHLEFETGS